MCMDVCVCELGEINVFLCFLFFVFVEEGGICLSSLLHHADPLTFFSSLLMV